MRRAHPLLALMAALCLGFVVTACGGDDEKSSSSSSSSSDAPGNEIQKVSGAESKPTITVGSKNFPEQFVLGEIYSQALEAAGFKVKTSLDIGSELIAHKALQGGKIDAYPEYTGTALINFFKRQAGRHRARRQQGLRGHEGLLRQGGHHRARPDAVREHLPARHDQGGAAKIGNLKTISDLEGKESELAITGFPGGSSARTACSACRTPTA